MEAIGQPSIMVEIMLGANEAIEVVKSADENEGSDGNDNDDKRSHLTR